MDSKPPERHAERSEASRRQCYIITIAREMSPAGRHDVSAVLSKQLQWYIRHSQNYAAMYVYLLTNPAHTVLYIGVTNDLERRLHEHSQNVGNAGKFTGRYQCNLLVYFEICADAVQAIAREKELKGWSRAKKEALIAAANPKWKVIDLETWSG